MMITAMKYTKEVMCNWKNGDKTPVISSHRFTHEGNNNDRQVKTNSR